MAAHPLNVDWDAIRRAFEVGSSLEQISATFGVPLATVRKRSQRGQWLSPGKVQKALESGDLGIVPGKSKHSPNARGNDSVIAALAGTWATKGAEHRELVFEKAHKALKAANMAAPVKWSDFEIADRIARKAAGLESGDAQVNIAVLPSGWPKPASENGGWSGQTVDIAPNENAEGPELLDSEPSEE